MSPIWQTRRASMPMQSSSLFHTRTKACKWFMDAMSPPAKREKAQILHSDQAIDQESKTTWKWYRPQRILILKKATPRLPISGLHVQLSEDPSISFPEPMRTNAVMHTADKVHKQQTIFKINHQSWREGRETYFHLPPYANALQKSRQCIHDQGSWFVSLAIKEFKKGSRWSPFYIQTFLPCWVKPIQVWNKK